MIDQDATGHLPCVRAILAAAKMALFGGALLINVGGLLDGIGGIAQPKDGGERRCA